jgi:hypothetical protein
MTMDQLEALQSAGLTLPSVAYIAGSILFGLLGFAAYRWGKATSRRGPYWIGIALMIYPYFTGETWALYAVGTALCGAIFVFPA